MYSLKSVKNKAINFIRRNYDENKQEKIKKSQETFSPKNLIKNNIDFIYKDCPGFLLNESAVDFLLNNLEEKGVSGVSKIKDSLSVLEIDTPEPIKINTFDDFINYNKQSDNKIKKSVINLQKEKEKAEKNKNKKENLNNFIKKFENETKFLSIDFECFFHDNKIPLEVGMCFFSKKDTPNNFQAHHLIFSDNEHLLKKQPDKFKSHHDFLHGETAYLKKEEIKEKMQSLINESDYIVCHASAMEKKMMNSLGLDFSSSKIIDSQITHRLKNEKDNVASIEKIAFEYGKDSQHLHNAGNDAFFIGEYFLDIVKKKSPAIKMETEPKTSSQLNRNKP